MHNSGFSLVELLIAMAIAAILAAIAVPAYNTYIQESRYSTMRTTFHDLRTMVEAYRLENGNYGTAGTTYSLTTSPTVKTLYEWDPASELSGYNYFVIVPSSSVSYDLLAVHTTGAWSRCDDRMTNCCEGTGGSPTTTRCP